MADVDGCDDIVHRHSTTLLRRRKTIAVVAGSVFDWRYDAPPLWMRDEENLFCSFIGDLLWIPRPFEIFVVGRIDRGARNDGNVTARLARDDGNVTARFARNDGNVTARLARNEG